MSGVEEFAIGVIGGAVAGAEAAGIFARSGVLTVVFEQNARPYGKIEDGLPRWHEGLRRKEYATIDARIRSDHVHFVPKTKIGVDVTLRELLEDWGLHAVVLANGAWRDRPLPVKGAEAYLERGLLYQNAFIHSFNHHHEGGYDGPRYDAPDGTIVVGGGLASIDVAKAVQLELTIGALRKRGIEVDLAQTELRGIPAMLSRHDLRWQDLGLRGCTIYYRRRERDMPLVEMPEGANEKVREKIEATRARMLTKARDKYLFGLQVLHAPVGLLTQAESLVGLTFARTTVVDGRAVIGDERVDVRAPLVISSIGSVPEPIEGIDMRGDLYAFDDWELGRMSQHPILFSVGNVVTGKGNILASRRHAGRVATYVTEEYLRLVDEVSKRPPLTPAARDALLARVRGLQARAGYDGHYDDWIASVTPVENG